MYWVSRWVSTGTRWRAGRRAKCESQMSGGPGSDEEEKQGSLIYDQIVGKRILELSYVQAHKVLGFCKT